MTWWTTVAGLTPIAIHDANNVSGTQLLDCIGSNHITATTALYPGSGPYVDVSGNGAAMSYASAIAVPTNCTIAALISELGDTTVFFDTSSGGMLFEHRASGGEWINGNASGSFSIFGYGSISNVFRFVALVKTGTSAVMYIDGAQLGSAVSNKTPPHIDRIGNTSTYTFSSSEFISALGIWSGSATQAELVALEAACRSALAHTITYHGYASLLGHTNHAPANALDSTGVRNINRLQSIGVRNLYYGGTGRITGTVKEKANPTNHPLHRKVLLLDEVTRTVIAETWSDATTGNYTFSNVAMQATYTVMTFDYLHNYRAVIADNLTPELMP